MEVNWFLTRRTEVGILCDLIFLLTTNRVCNYFIGIPAAIFFRFKSLTAAFIASSASIEQWSFTGGKLRCFAISSFFIATASSMCCPCTHSVTTLLLAIAEPQPNVLKQESTILPSPSTLIWSFMTSPHAGAPTSPVPTLMSSLSADK